MTQISCICILQITTFFAWLSSCQLLYIIILSVPVSSEMQHCNYCNIGPNQHRSHGPIFCAMKGYVSVSFPKLNVSRNQSEWCYFVVANRGNAYTCTWVHNLTMCNFSKQDLLITKSKAPLLKGLKVGVEIFLPLMVVWKSAIYPPLMCFYAISLCKLSSLKSDASKLISRLLMSVCISLFLDDWSCPQFCVLCLVWKL